MRRSIFVVFAALATLWMGLVPALAVDQPPIVTVLDDPLVVEASSPSGEYVDISQAVDVDGYPGDVAVMCQSEALGPHYFMGSWFPIGSTFVECEATPITWTGDATLFSLTVEVVGDTTPPEIIPYQEPHLVGAWYDDMGGNEGFGAWVNLESNIRYITEPLSVPLECVSTPAVDGYWFLEGTYEVICTATDTWGNTGYGSYTLHVIDPQDYFGHEIAVVGARFEKGTGIALVTVAATANHDGWMQAGVNATQYFANRFAIVGFGDSGWYEYSAGDMWTYTIEVAGENGRFGGGRIELRLDARICQHVMAGMCDWTGNDGLVVQTNLRGGYKG